MKRYQMILGAIAAFDLAYVAFACAEDCCSRLHSRWKKKHGVADEEELEFFNAEDDPDYSPAPPLCVDAIRMVSPFHIRDLVVDRIFPEGKSMVDALGGLDRDGAKLLLSSYIGFLVQKAPEEEQNFPMLLELLNASKVYDDPDSKNAVDLMMEEDARDRNPLPQYYADYQEYRLICIHKERVINTCRVIVSDIIRKLYGDYYDMHVEEVLKTVSDRLAVAKDDALFYEEVE